MSPKLWILAAVAVIAVYLLGSANTIPTLDEKVKTQWAEVQNQYQRRMDLIPNLVETVKGYANFEQKTLTDVVNARANATKVTLTADQLTDPEAVKKFEQAQSQLSSTLSRLLVTVEKYPDLKANQNFIALQSQLEGTENRIAITRKDYIEAVQAYNIQVRTFPGIIWAKIYGAKPKETYTASEGADKPPAVKF